MKHAIWALALTGCYRPAGVASCAVACDSTHACPSGLECDGTLCHESGATCGPDAGSAGSDAPGTFCFTPALLPMICAQLPLRTSYFSVGVNTSDVQQCDVVIPRGANSELCVIVADDIAIANTLRANGSRSFVLAARKSLVVSGTIDVSSTLATPGAGATKKCSPESAGENETAGIHGAGGGGGGSFGTLGGTGGSNAGTTVGGPPSNAPAPGVFDAGVSGGLGGNALSGFGGGGACGLGGGAVYLYAQGSITIFGKVLAFGSGGGGAVDVYAGGGGGGAGGMIVVDAPEYLSGSSTVLGATGGGGGGGASGSSGGDSGISATATTVSTPAHGGVAVNAGGDGATGTAAQGRFDATKGRDGPQQGGGGGGGGAGVIHLPLDETSQGSIYPAPS